MENAARISTCGRRAADAHAERRSSRRTTSKPIVRFLDEPGILQAGKESPGTRKRRPSKLRKLCGSVDPSTLNVQKVLWEVSTKKNLQHELIEVGEEVADVRPGSSGLPWPAHWSGRQ